MHRGDTNRPPITLPGLSVLLNEYTFGADVWAGIDEPSKYTLREGITLDKEVFDAYSKEFGVQERRVPGDNPAFLLLSGTQLQEFHQFHSAFRYGREIQRLEKKLSKEKDSGKREKLQKKIQQRKNSSAYKKYGRIVERYL